MLWAGLDDLLITGHDNGDLVQWDVKTQKKLKMSSDHEKTIMDMQSNKDGSGFITSSKDCKRYPVDSLVLNDMTLLYCAACFSTPTHWNVSRHL